MKESNPKRFNHLYKGGHAVKPSPGMFKNKSANRPSEVMSATQQPKKKSISTGGSVPDVMQNGSGNRKSL